MKTILAALGLAMLFSCSIQAQHFTEKELTGKWKVVNTEITATGEIAQYQKTSFDLIKSQFVAAKFVFYADNNFDFTLEQTQMNKAHWKLDSTGTNVIVQEWKDKDTDKGVIMNIGLDKEGAKKFFIFSGMFTRAEVVKE